MRSRVRPQEHRVFPTRHSSICMRYPTHSMPTSLAFAGTPHRVPSIFLDFAERFHRLAAMSQQLVARSLRDARRSRRLAEPSLPRAGMSTRPAGSFRPLAETFHRTAERSCPIATTSPGFRAPSGPRCKFGDSVGQTRPRLIRPSYLSATAAKSRSCCRIASRTVRNALRRCSSLPTAALGSSKLQWIRRPWPGNIGQLSFARSQTVMT